MKIFYLLTLIFVFLSCLHSTVLAADYGVSPIIIDRNIEARESFEESVKITNTSDRKLRLFPTVNAITLGVDGEIVDFVPASMGNTATSITSWISVTRGRVEINPGETVKIPLTIAVSPFAEPGEYHAFVGFAEGSKRDDAEVKVENRTAPGVVMRLSLSEKRTEYLRLQRFSIDRFITDPNNAVATYVIENVGGKPLTPTGEIIFYDVRGTEQGSVVVNPEQKEIRPQSSLTFTTTIPDIGAIGKHKAFINIEYGSTQRANVYDTAYFNIVPIGLLLTIFVTLLVISVIVTLLYHRRTRTRVVSDDEEEVAVYVRTGITGAEKDHDINLKQ